MIRLSQHPVYFYFRPWHGSATATKTFYSVIANRAVEWINRVYDIDSNRLFYLAGVRYDLDEPVPSYGSAYILPANRFGLHVHVAPYVVGESAGTCLHRMNGDADLIARVDDYSDMTLQQIILHESGHAFGVAIGEYYSIRSVVDLTSAEPTLKVGLGLVSDAYWNHRPRWNRDPMLDSSTWSPVFSPLSDIVIRHGLWREQGPPCPNLMTIPCRLPDYLCDQPRIVDVYRMSKTSQGYLATVGTSADGRFWLDWMSDAQNAVSNYQMIKLIVRGATPGRFPFGVSIFDVQYAWLSECERQGKIAWFPPQEIEYCVQII